MNCLSCVVVDSDSPCGQKQYEHHHHLLHVHFQNYIYLKQLFAGYIVTQ